MSDDKTSRGPQDATRIALGQNYEAEYWSDKFGVTRHELEQAVRAVGSSADSVERHLKSEN